MTRGWRHRLAACASGLALLAACGEGFGPAFGPAFPSDRSAWDGAPQAARAAHARGLHLLLDNMHRQDVATWQGGGAGGEISVETYWPEGETFCAIVRDRIDGPAGSATARDLLCWGDGWVYVRDDPLPDVPVLAPAFAEEERVYTVRSGGTLGAVARRTGAPVAELRALNPGHPERLAAGTRVLLP